MNLPVSHGEPLMKPGEPKTKTHASRFVSMKTPLFLLRRDTQHVVQKPHCSPRHLSKAEVHNIGV